MTYKEEFLEAFCARKKYLPDAKPEKFLSYKDFNSFRASEDEARAYSFFEKIDSYFEQVLLPTRQKFNQPIANACHVISFQGLIKAKDSFISVFWVSEEKCQIFSILFAHL